MSQIREFDKRFWHLTDFPTFKSLKPAAAILSLLWGFLMLQPSFTYFGGMPAYGTCNKSITKETSCSKKKETGFACTNKKESKPACSKNKCNQPSTPEKQGDCDTKGCNPSLGCSSGNFFIHNYHLIAFESWSAKKLKKIVTDDDRISKNLTECWHPPEAGSISRINPTT